MPPTPTDTDELLRAAGHGDEAPGRAPRPAPRPAPADGRRADGPAAGRPGRPLGRRAGGAGGRGRGLSAYLRDRPLPFYPWLRQVAWRRLVQLYRHHVVARRRSVNREVPGRAPLADASAHLLAAACLAAGGSSPSRALIREELLDRVHAALARLDPRDRDLLVMRHLEGMSSAEVGAILGVGEGAVRVRLVRALKRLRGLLDGEDGDRRAGHEHRPTRPRPTAPASDRALGDLIDELTDRLQAGEAGRPRGVRPPATPSTRARSASCSRPWR